MVIVGVATEDTHALVQYTKFIMYSKAMIDQVIVDKIILNFVKKVIMSEVDHVVASY